MKYYVEESLTNFKFWSGAADRAKTLTYDELEQLDDVLQEYLGDDVSDIDINDAFWLDFGNVCELIGLRVNSADEPIRCVADVDTDVTNDAVKDWAEENYMKLDDASLIRFRDALIERNVLDYEETTGEVVVMNDDAALDLAKELGYYTEDEDADEFEEE